MASIPTWFDYDIYMDNKLDQLKNAEPDANWNMDKLVDTFAKNGFVGEEGAYKHFVDFGADEEVSPNADFNAEAYYISKAAQFYGVKPSEVTESQVAVMVKAFDDNGLNAWTHYQLYGTSEGVNPSNDFDTSAYMDAKLAQMQVEDPDYTMADLVAAFNAAGLSALEHYFLYGKDEGITATPVSGDEIIPAEPQPDEPTPEEKGEDYYLTTGQDMVTGTDKADTFHAYEFDGVNTLQSGDVLKGGAGTDTLEADVAPGTSFGAAATTITPATDSIEIVKFRVQQPVNDWGDNNVANDGRFTSEATIDAERMQGVKEFWSQDSRADLTIEDVRIDSNTVTIGMGNTDPGDVDYNVFFDPQHLKGNGAVADGAELTLQLIDTQGAAKDAEHPLASNPYTGFSFTYNGETKTVNFGEYNDGKDADGTATYEELAAIIQAALDKDFPDLGLKVSVEGSFNATAGIGEYEGQTVIGQNIVISGPTNVTLGTGNWIAANGLPTTNSVAASMTDVAPTTDCPLISTNVVLDNVGRVNWEGNCDPANGEYGSEAGDLVIGSMADRGGVELFNVTVKSGSWLNSMSSTNDTLEKVFITEGSTGNLYIGGNDDNNGNANLQQWTDAPEYLEQGGLTNVRVFDAANLKGDVNVNANLNKGVFQKYLDQIDDDTQSNPIGDDAHMGEFKYTTGTGDDTLNLTVDANVTADSDFTLAVSTGAGNDNIRLNYKGAGNGNAQFDQHILKNVTIDAGEGDDVIETMGGHTTINAGSGDDTVYADNTGDTAVVVLNAFAQGVQYVQFTANGVAPLNNDIVSADKSFSFTDAALKNMPVTLTVTVTYRGVEAKADLTVNLDDKGNVSLTDLQINQLIKDAVNNDADLGQLLLAQDGAGHSLILGSLIDGQITLDDLNVSFGTSYVNADGKTVQNVFNTGVLDNAYNEAGKQFGVDNGGFLNGSDSTNHSDNIINLGDGADVAVLGTGTHSNDTVVFSGSSIGSNTIVNFDADNNSNGRDFLDFSAYLGGNLKGLSFTNTETALTSSKAIVVLANEEKDGKNIVTDAASLEKALNDTNGIYANVDPYKTADGKAVFLIADDDVYDVYTADWSKGDDAKFSNVTKLGSVELANVNIADLDVNDFIPAAPNSVSNVITVPDGTTSVNGSALGKSTVQLPTTHLDLTGEFTGATLLGQDGTVDVEHATGAFTLAGYQTVDGLDASAANVTVDDAAHVTVNAAKGLNLADNTGAFTNNGDVTIDATNATEAVTVTLGKNMVTGANGTFTIEAGDKGINLLTDGDTNANWNSPAANHAGITAYGAKGNDTLRGTAGDDVLYGSGHAVGGEETGAGIKPYGFVAAEYNGVKANDAQMVTKINELVVANRFNGLAGDDTMYASKGVDSFEFHTTNASDQQGYATASFATQGTDTIVGFELGKDNLFINMIEADTNADGHGIFLNGNDNTGGFADILSSALLSAGAAAAGKVTVSVQALDAAAVAGLGVTNDGKAGNDFHVTFTFGEGANADTLTLNLVDVQPEAGHDIPAIGTNTDQVAFADALIQY